MSFLYNLKSIFKIKVDLSKLTSIHLFSDNKNEQVTYIDKRTIYINIANTKDKDVPKLEKAIKDAVKKENNLLIEEAANKLLNDISKVENNVENTRLIQFFRGKISNNDLEIFRASLYVKNVYDRGQQVGDLKRDIILKFGDRGRNIVNLCTAGYFTSLIKPLYNEMLLQSNFTPNLFLETFDTIVNQSPFAIFVGSPMTKDQLLSEVVSKMEVNKKYGINYLNIHGIGEHNVSKIEFILTKLKDKFASAPDIESGRKYITVTIYF